MRIQTLKLFTLVNAVAALGFGGWTLAILSQGLALPAAAPAEWQPPPEDTGGSAAIPQAAISFDQALARPLFEASRRPFTAPPASQQEPIQTEPPAAAPAPPPALRIAGILRTGQLSAALVMSPDLPAGRWVTAGETVAGWTLRRITQEGVEIDYGAGQTTLTLYPELQSPGQGNGPMSTGTDEVNRP